MNTDIDDAYACEIGALDDFIAEQPAIGVAGIALKFQRLCEHVNVETLSIWGSDYVRTITEALERFAKA